MHAHTVDVVRFATDYAEARTLEATVLVHMEAKTLTVPELGFIVGTRGALGAGIGLLLSERLTPPVRRAVGLTLVAIGALTTIPAAIAVFGRRPTQLPT